MGGWRVPDLIRHLEARGLGLRAHSTSKAGVIIHNVFLTTGPRSWATLSRLGMYPEAIADWDGVAYCEYITWPQERELEVGPWGACGLRVDPFLFFGDPRLLEQIRRALTAPGE
jgi:hypothetical protein